MAESPVRRRPGGGHHKRSSSLSWLVDLITSDPKPPEPEVKAFDPEEMTKQERISRMLHAPHLQQSRRADALMYEHFLVWRWPVAGEDTPAPALVLNYPLGKGPEIPGLVDFCFPAGWVRRRAGEDGGRSEFIFMLTTDEGPLFGIVVHAPFEPYGLCLCMLSRFPLFRLHFELLDSIYAVCASSPTSFVTSDALPLPPSPAPAAVDLTRRSLDDISANAAASGAEAPSSPNSNSASTANATTNNSSPSHHFHSRSSSSPALAAPVPSSPPATPTAMGAQSSINVSLPSTPQVLQSPMPVTPSLTLPPSALSRFKSEMGFPEAPKRPIPSPSPFTGASGSPMPQAGSELSPRDRLRKILKAYRKVAVPERGKSLHFFVPNDPRLIQFKRPMDDEDDDAELFADYAAGTLWSVLSRNSLLTLVTAVLLEKKIAIYALRERIVAACAVALLPLLRPFRYQASFIPLLPTRLHSFLEAPVPFLVGLVELPARDHLPADVILFNLDQFLQCSEPLPILPDGEELDKALRGMEKQFKKISNARLKPSAALSVEQSQLLQRMGKAMHDHFAACLDDYRRHCIRDMTDKAKPITVFLKDSFLAEAPDEDRPFYKAFFETQTWFHYSDHLLRSADAHEPEV